MTIAAARNQYAELVHGFPPRPIHNLRQYNATVAVMNKLAIKDENTLTPAESDYLDALSTFIEKYDEEHFPIPDNSSPLQRLQYLIEQSALTASDLGRLLGNRTLGSILLTGKRELSKSHIRTLASRFKLDPGYFM